MLDSLRVGVERLKIFALEVLHEFLVQFRRDTHEDDKLEEAALNVLSSQTKVFQQGFGSSGFFNGITASNWPNMPTQKEWSISAAALEFSHYLADHGHLPTTEEVNEVTLAFIAFLHEHDARISIPGVRHI